MKKNATIRDGYRHSRRIPWFLSSKSRRGQSTNLDKLAWRGVAGMARPPRIEYPRAIYYVMASFGRLRPECGQPSTHLSIPLSCQRTPGPNKTRYLFATSESEGERLTTSIWADCKCRRL